MRATPAAREALPAAPPLSRARVVSARVLTIAGLALALVSLVAVYVHYELLDRPTFRGNASRLLEDRAIQKEFATSAVDALYANVDVPAVIEERLPPPEKPLAIPLAAALRTLAERVADDLLARPGVQARLVDSLEFTHRQLVRLLENRDHPSGIEGKIVSLQLAPLVSVLVERIGLPAAEAAKVRESASRIDLIRSNQLPEAQRAVHILDVLATWLWLVALACAVAAVLLVPGRRRTELRAIAVGLVVVGLLVVLFRRVAGTYLVDHLVADVAARPAARDAYDIVTRDLRGAGITDLLVGLVALIGVWLAGPRPRAQAVLRFLAPWLRRPLPVYGTYALAWLLLLLWQPTVQFGRPRYILLMLVSGAIGLEALRRLATKRYPAAEPIRFTAWLQEWWASFRRPRHAARDTDAAQLQTLADLHDAGKLTDQEFAAAKTRLVS